VSEVQPAEGVDQRATSAPLRSGSPGVLEQNLAGQGAERPDDLHQAVTADADRRAEQKEPMPDAESTAPAAGPEPQHFDFPGWTARLQNQAANRFPMEAGVAGIAALVFPVQMEPELPAHWPGQLG
jgi:hypothetical protein